MLGGLLKQVLTLGVPYAAKKIFGKKDQPATTTETLANEAINLLVDRLLKDRAPHRAPVTRRDMSATIEQLLAVSQGSAMDISSILPLVQSLLSAVTGGKSGEIVSGTADEFGRAGDAAGQVQELLYACRDAVADGVLTWDEIQNILKEAQDVPDALQVIFGAKETGQGEQ